MSRPGSISGWLDALRVRDEVATQRLWQEYFRRLVGLARARMGGRPAGPDGSEDIALSAFNSFCRGAEAGRFPALADRNDLWQILMMLTARKSIDAIDRERAIKRGGGRVRSIDGPSFEEVVGVEPTPSFAAEVAEEFRGLLDRLDAELRPIALWKLEGFTNAEIAVKIGRAIATVERKLDKIRKTWKA